MSKTVLFQNIQLNISTQFSSIWPIDKNLSGFTAPGQSGPGSDGNERGTPHSPKLQDFWSLTIRLFSVTSRTLIGEFYLPAEMQLVCSTIQTDWANVNKGRLAFFINHLWKIPEFIDRYGELVDWLIDLF